LLSFKPPFLNKPFTPDTTIVVEELTDYEIMAAQAYLYLKYHPGNCFGMPTFMSAADMRSFNGASTEYPDAAELLRTVYGIQAEDQLNGIITGMHRIKYQDHQFSFTDGRCCESTSYTISIQKTPDGFTDTILHQHDRTGITC
jgi:hypothetical protein